MIRDSNGILLTADVQKGKYIYYKNQNLRSSCRVNISQKIVEDTVVEKLKDYTFPISQYEHCLKFWKAIIAKKNGHIMEMEEEIEKEIKLHQEKENRLLNGYLEWTLEWNIYKKAYEGIAEKITLLKARKQEIKRVKVEDFEKRMREMFELVENLSESYKHGNLEIKHSLHRKLEIELSINDKKELTIADSRLFIALKALNFNCGNATENRTPITGMRIPCPNR